MHRRPVRWRPEAVADIEDILRYVAQASGSVEVAERFVRRIMDRCARLGETPLAGRTRDDLRPDLRIIPFERRVVIACVAAPDAVRIVDIFYGGRDFEALYRGIAPDDHEDG